VTLAVGAAIDGSVRLALGDGVNSTTLAGEIDGSISVDGCDGDNTVTIAATAVIAGNFFARLGGRVNNVVHDGVVGSDLTDLTAREDDLVTIAETAVGRGDTNLLRGLADSVPHCALHAEGLHPPEPA
jgi:hypothetical protein